MSDSLVQIEFTLLFKRRLKGLAKKYRQIQTDLQPIFDQLLLGNVIGDQIPGTAYTVYKVRARNSDAQSGKSGGYRLIYQVLTPTDIVFHLIYSKSEQSTVSADEIQDMIAAYQKEREQN
ncbi:MULTISPECIES: type II toxin-antitoxin system RelE/ParE family toxin [Leptolyngbya]|uniref:type II toxin-antitoxin system RelE/ParE family toxin n=1 Tax=Leptolyngbya TaxID=47251 RepID=UPI0016859B6C|nr:type II toxin-antitoxin system RelE/ParE family toxin [Leptolyngbya sp. FACHB-1624]MBD1854169.1 type II toxin-antitoxin system RelE/ParE family toxin [Leptolyngbya sp. FACHB-1624]